ncbi:GNAT family N-acetyltransferase [Streptococcus sobrinus]|uniref:GNAT family N-acetyltransferase n=1 Tax=Streptococcus sobrinus TaxID=1310 RepID=UPI0002DA9479|nr:GNAT family N-acetyltransferase [Streptococcus sobrinus]
MIIRRIREKDLWKVTSLFNDYRQISGQKATSQEAYNFLKERFDKQESLVFVAEKAGKILVFTQVYPIFSSIQMKKAYLLNDLYVIKEARGLGIGSSLVKEVFATVKTQKAAFVLLETAVGNQAAQSVYQSLGMHREDDVYYFSKKF